MLTISKMYIRKVIREYGHEAPITVYFADAVANYDDVVKMNIQYGNTIFYKDVVNFLNNLYNCYKNYDWSDLEW